MPLVVMVPSFSTVTLLALVAVTAVELVVNLPPELMVPVSPVARVFCEVSVSPSAMVNSVDQAQEEMVNKIIVNRITVKRGSKFLTGIHILIKIKFLPYFLLLLLVVINVILNIINTLV